MPDRFFYPLAALVVAGLIGLALVYPQGGGTPSPGPFRRPVPVAPPPAAAPVRPPAPATAPANDASQVRTRPLP